MEIIYDNKDNISHYKTIYFSEKKLIYIYFGGKVNPEKMVESLRETVEFMKKHDVDHIFQNMSELQGTPTVPLVKDYLKKEFAPFLNDKIKDNFLAGVKDPFMRFGVNIVVPMLGKMNYTLKITKTLEEGVTKYKELNGIDMSLLMKELEG